MHQKRENWCTKYSSKYAIKQEIHIKKQSHLVHTLYKKWETAVTRVETRNVYKTLAMLCYGREKQKPSRREYDKRVMLDVDGSTHSMKFPLESFSTDEGDAVGAWVLLKVAPQEGMGRPGRALTPNGGTRCFG